MAEPLRKRAYNKSHVEIALNVRQYFEMERNNPDSIDVSKVVERTAAATGISARTINKIRNEEDVENWTKQKISKLSYDTKLTVPENYAALVRTNST